MRKTPALAAAASVTAAIACFAVTPAHASPLPVSAAGATVGQHGFGFDAAAARAHEATLSRGAHTRFTDLTSSSNRQTAIEQAISSGLPVAIGFNARSSFDYLNSTNYNYNPTKHQRIIGGHEVTIVGYNSTGVTIENSWGTSWGNAGFFTAPWSWIAGSDVNEVNSMGKLVPTS